EELTGSLRRKILLTSYTIILIIVTSAITGYLTKKGLQSFIVNGINPLEFLTSKNWNPTNLNEPQYRSLPFIFGSLAVTLLAAIVAAPLGISGVIFMTEIVPGWRKRILQPVIELLVGIPSVVYGFIGLTILVPFIRDKFEGSSTGF